MEARWSTWVKQYTTKCLTSCSRQVQFKRYCTNPPPVIKTKGCVGNSRETFYEQCIGGDCSKYLDRFIVLIRTQHNVCNNVSKE